MEPNKGEEAEWAGGEEPKTSPVDEEARLDPTLGAIRICGSSSFAILNVENYYPWLCLRLARNDATLSSTA